MNCIALSFFVEFWLARACLPFPYVHLLSIDACAFYQWCGRFVGKIYLLVVLLVPRIVVLEDRHSSLPRGVVLTSTSVSHYRRTSLGFFQKSSSIRPEEPSLVCLVLLLPCRAVSLLSHLPASAASALRRRSWVSFASKSSFSSSSSPPLARWLNKCFRSVAPGVLPFLAPRFRRTQELPPIA